VNSTVSKSPQGKIKNLFREEGRKVGGFNLVCDPPTRTGQTQVLGGVPVWREGIGVGVLAAQEKEEKGRGAFRIEFGGGRGGNAVSVQLRLWKMSGETSGREKKGVEKNHLFVVLGGKRVNTAYFSGKG